MIEIEKLRKRLRNVNKNVVDYKMTMAEAKNLLFEIDTLLKPPAPTPVAAPTEIAKQVMDGGSFTDFLPEQPVQHVRGPAL